MTSKMIIISLNMWSLFIIFILNLTNVKCKVKLIEGSYENLVVKFDNEVSDFYILNSTKSALDKFSFRLHDKTNARLSINEVVFILPENSSWIDLLQKENQTVQYLSDETTANEASIIVGNPKLSKEKDLPYVTHLGECGDEGEHIFLPTLSHILNNTAIGNILLHEWAHYRWGVFDEYSSSKESENESPFYFTEDKKISITGCPQNLSGWLLTKNKTKCSLNDELLPDQNCLFFVHSGSKELPRRKTSIMMDFNNKTGDYFCGSNGHEEMVKHDSRAPNPHNKKCGGKSSWEIMLRHQDFKSDTTHKCRKQLCKITNYKYLIRKKIDNLLIITDKNLFIGSLSEKLIQVFASLKALGNLVELNVEMRNETFREDETRKSLIENHAKNLEDSHVFFLLSEKCQSCLEDSLTLLRKIKYSLIYLKNVDNDSKDNSLSAKKLVEVPLHLSFSEVLDSFIENAFRKVIQREAMPFTVYKMRRKGVPIKGNFALNKFCTKVLFVATSSERLGQVTLINPQNKTCTKRKRNDGSVCSVWELEPTVAAISINIQEDPTLVGEWSYEINEEYENYLESTVRVFCISNKSSNNLMSVTPKVSLRSSEADFNASDFDSKITFAVLVSDNHRPVVDADVDVIIATESGKEIRISCFDNGIGSDSVKDDGIYSGEFLSFAEIGIHVFSFKVSTTNKTNVSVKLKHFQESSQFKSTFESIGSRQPSQFKIVDFNDLQHLKETFGEPKSTFSLADFESPNENEKAEFLQHRYIIEKLSEQERYAGFVPVTVIDYTDEDHHPPGRVSDLRIINLSYLESTVTLEWTCTGDDGFYYGRANRTVLKYNYNREYYPSNFDSEGIQIRDEDLRKGTSLTPLNAQQKQRIIVAVPKGDGYFPENSVFFFSLVILDEAGHKSSVSNLATAFFKPKEFSKELQMLNQKSMNSFMALLVFLFFIAFIGAVIVIVKIFHKRSIQITNTK